MRLVFGCDDAVADWVAARIPAVRWGGEFGGYKAIGVARDDKLLAGVVYHGWMPLQGIMELSMAADRPTWARWPVIMGLLMYPFVDCGVRVLQTITPHTNEKALKVNKHIGFTREGVLRRRFDEKTHAVVMSLLRDDYRRLVAEHGGPNG